MTRTFPYQISSRFFTLTYRTRVARGDTVTKKTLANLMRKSAHRVMLCLYDYM